MWDYDYYDNWDDSFTDILEIFNKEYKDIKMEENDESE